MNSAFYYTGDILSKEFEDITHSGEITARNCNLSHLIRACNSDCVSYQKDTRGVPLADKMSFFIRTSEGNYVVVKKSDDGNCKPLYYADLTQFDSGTSLNDCMLLCARDYLKEVFSKYPLETIGLNSIPTPFGSTLENKSVNFVFQLVVTQENLPDLSEGYEYVPVDDLKNRWSFHAIYKSFVYTETEVK